MWLCVWLLCTTWVRHDSCVTFGKENLKRNDATIPRLNFSPSSPEAHCLLPVGEAGKPVQMSCQWYWDAIKSAGRPCNQLGYVGTIWDVCAGSMVAKRAWEILRLSFLLMQSCRGLLHWAGQSCLACAFSSVSRHLLDLLKIPSWIVMMESGQQRDIRGVGFGATKESSQSSWNIICLRYRTSVGSFHRGYLPPRGVCGTDHAAGHEGQGCQARWGRHKKLQKVTWHVRVCQSLSESGPYQRTPLGNLHLSASLCISLWISLHLFTLRKKQRKSRRAALSTALASLRCQGIWTQPLGKHGKRGNTAATCGVRKKRPAKWADPGFCLHSLGRFDQTLLFKSKHTQQ